MKLCGETLFDKVIMKTILRTLQSQFDHLVITIKETKDLNDVNIEELQGALEARDLKINGRKDEKEEEQALLTRFKQEESKELWKKKRERTSTNKQKHGDNPGSSKNRGESYKNQGKKFDKNKVQCFNCDRYGYIASECWFNKDRKGKRREQEAYVAQEDSNSDSDTVILMATTSDKESAAI